MMMTTTATATMMTKTMVMTTIMIRTGDNDDVNGNFVDDENEDEVVAA